MAMIFQTFALYPHLTAYRQSRLSAARGQGRPQAEIDRRVNEIAEMLRISHALDRKPATLAAASSSASRSAAPSSGGRGCCCSTSR